MRIKRNKTSIKYIWFTVLFTIIVASVFSVCIYAVQNINRSQYKERVENSNILMEKICNHIETALDFNWERLHYIAKQIESETFTSLQELRNFVEICEKNVKEKEYTKILLISETGFCYVTDGTSFKWMIPSLLNEETDVMHVSDYQFASKTDVQMHYISRFDEPLVVEGITFTHISLVCDMSELDKYFDVSNYGDESITFIIHKDGSQVYRQRKQTVLSGIYNLLSALKNAKFSYGASIKQLQEDIENNVNDSIHLTLNGVGYFTSYYKIGIKDWVVVLMVPEEYVGIGTRIFTKEIIISVFILSGTLLVMLIFIAGTSIYQIGKKQKQVNEQLIKAIEAEHAANEAKTTFLSSMSHDIRTPMNAIVGMITIAQKHVADTKYIKECLDKVKLASGHLLTLINDILDISKVESGMMKLNADSFSLTDNFKSLVSMLQSQVKEKNIDLQVEMHHIPHEYLYGDKLRLNQIYINILNNAIKYTKDNGHIWVKLFEESIEGRKDIVRIKYMVKDTGVGMSKDFQEIMYQSFLRADETRISKIHGSGLGLAICKQLVDLMGGTIQCESEVGVGTTFVVTIDMLVADMEMVANEQEVTFDYEKLAGIRLLVAEDNDMNWEIASTLLDMYGIITERAENGKICTEMVTAAEEGYYSLVLMDVRMPMMDGKEATRVIRNSDKEWVRKMPVIAMTADAFIEDIRECKEAGMDEHLSKPIDIDRLLHIIKKYCVIKG